VVTVHHRIRGEESPVAVAASVAKRSSRSEPSGDRFGPAWTVYVCRSRASTGSPSRRKAAAASASGRWLRHAWTGSVGAGVCFDPVSGSVIQVDEAAALALGEFLQGLTPEGSTSRHRGTLGSSGRCGVSADGAGVLVPSKGKAGSRSPHTRATPRRAAVEPRNFTRDCGCDRVITRRRHQDSRVTSLQRTRQTRALVTAGRPPSRRSPDSLPLANRASLAP
jgi:hypothetical protein